MCDLFESILIPGVRSPCKFCCLYGYVTAERVNVSWNRLDLKGPSHGTVRYSRHAIAVGSHNTFIESYPDRSQRVAVAMAAGVVAPLLGLHRATMNVIGNGLNL